MAAMADDRPGGGAGARPDEDIHDDDELAAALAAELERIAPTGAVPVLRASAVPFGPLAAPAVERPSAPLSQPALASAARPVAPVLPAPSAAPRPAPVTVPVADAEAPAPVAALPSGRRANTRRRSGRAEQPARTEPVARTEPAPSSTARQAVVPPTAAQAVAPPTPS